MTQTVTALWLLTGMGGVFVLLGGGLWYAGARLRTWRPGWAWIERLLALMLLLVGITSLLAGVGLLWSVQPGDRGVAIERELWPGVRHVREVLDQPRPNVVNLVWVDLQRPGGAELVATITDPAQTITRAEFKAELRTFYPEGAKDDAEPGDEIEQVVRFAAQRTSDFLQSEGLDIAINGGFFFPFKTGKFWDYYPQQGDPVVVNGVWGVDRQVVADHAWRGTEELGAVVYVNEEGDWVMFDEPPVTAETVNEHDGWVTVVSGHNRILDAGVVIGANPQAQGLYPRSVIGLTEDRRYAVFAVVDGRQPRYSEGMTLTEFGQYLKRQGVHWAMELDGGGSTTLVVRSEDGQPEVLNHPIDLRWPGRERAVGNHIGVKLGFEAGQKVND